ncbi:alpha-amylase [Desarmillaria tabescens]|uniref:alpha-amylase n=1 Tax=Armillaria tabescens TaxID=1929756 RepID=A0AA39JTE6_ARMTA|nr:alpha-amylase [Desarmillaria tabescens]KAK0448478.1 alpha-amylase [Desarmillaria tabescens]
MLSHCFATLLYVAPAFAASAANWRSRSIYQVVTDRFAMTDGLAGPCDPSARKYCGGTWQGLINRLDYIQNMGFDAIWISPVSANVEEETAYGDAYHGYWTRDLNTLNSKFGTPDDLKALSSALHDRNMYLMVDVVVNHYAAPPTNTSDKIPQSFNFTSLAPFTSENDFHPQCFITDTSNQTEVEQCWLGDTSLPLLDIDTENPTNFEILRSWIADLVLEYNIDGLRISAARYIRQSFWRDFTGASGVFAMGEILSDNVSYTSDYTQVLDAVLDYPTWFTLVEAFSDAKGNFDSLMRTVIESQGKYTSGLCMTGSFVENYDQPRFPSFTKDESLIKNVVTWPFIHDGIPIVYYGQEQGFQGGAVPNNHESLWSSYYHVYQKPLVQHITDLNAVRKLAINSKQDFLTTQMTFVPQLNDNTIAISKPPLLALLTNVGNSSTATWTIPGDAGLFLKGQTLIDVLTCQSYNVDPVTGSLTIESRNGLPQVILPARYLDSKGTLCASEAQNGTRRVTLNQTFVFGLAILVGFIATIHSFI